MGILLSYFLFLLAMEALSSPLGDSSRRGLLVSFQSERGWLCPISYLAKDTWSSVRIS